MILNPSGHNNCLVSPHKLKCQWNRWMELDAYFMIDSRFGHYCHSLCTVCSEFDLFSQIQRLWSGTLRPTSCFCSHLFLRVAAGSPLCKHLWRKLTYQLSPLTSLTVTSLHKVENCRSYCMAVSIHPKGCIYSAFLPALSSVHAAATGKRILPSGIVC